MKPLDILTKRHAEIRALHNFMYNEAWKLHRYSNYVGVLGTIFPLLAGATLLSQATSPVIKTVAGLFGLIASLLSGVQSFYNFPERYKLAKTSMDALDALDKEIEILLANFPPDINMQIPILESIDKRYIAIETKAPIIKIKKHTVKKHIDTNSQTWWSRLLRWLRHSKQDDGQN